VADPEREYDRTHLKPLDLSGARLRVAFDRDRKPPSSAAISRFVVQLEYLPEGDDADDESNWLEVVRSDHGPGEGEHDVTDEGVHLDVYRSGSKIGTDQLAGPMPPTSGFDRAEEHIRENAKAYVNRYQQWLRIDRKDD
jgi:hypothetical protein